MFLKHYNDYYFWEIFQTQHILKEVLLDYKFLLNQIWFFNFQIKYS
jgi:hypothetical protein